MTYVTLTCQWLLAAVFAVAAGGKVTPGRFREFVSAAGRLVPPGWWRWRRPVAVGVLVAELATVGLLVWPATALAGMALVGCLSAIFSSGMGAALRRGERAPCRCFGASQAALGGAQLARNAVIGAVAIAGIATGWGSPPAPAHQLAGAGLAAVLVGLVLAALVVRMDDLVALVAPMPARRE